MSTQLALKCEHEHTACRRFPPPNLNLWCAHCALRAHERNEASCAACTLSMRWCFTESRRAERPSQALSKPDTAEPIARVCGPGHAQWIPALRLFWGSPCCYHSHRKAATATVDLYWHHPQCVDSWGDEEDRASVSGPIHSLLTWTIMESC